MNRPERIANESELALDWSRSVFLTHFEKITPKIRALRLLEEAMELAQAEGVTNEEISHIRTQVYSKAPGDPYKELGGVMMTIAAYAGQRQWNFHNAFVIEYQRMLDPTLMARVRQRNLPGGDKIGLVL